MNDPMSPRAVAVLLARALRHVDRVQPPAAREPIAAMLAGGIELCAASRSLLGLPVNNLLALARALIDEEQADG